MKSLFFKIIACFILVCQVYAQVLPADNTFFNPTIGSATQTIYPSAGTGDDSQTFTNAINAVNAGGGGKVIVNPGTYRILEIDFMSNVHIEVDHNVTFIPFNPPTGNSSMFDAESNTEVTNFSLIGIGGNFNFDFTGLDPDDRIRAIRFNYCSNFKAANFNIDDNYTIFSGLIFGSNHVTTGSGDDRRITAIRGVPTGGIIENISITNAHYGYGLIQTQAGKNLLFRNLSGIGGATLRLETGYWLIQYTGLFDFEALKLDNIWARNIECTNGQSALQLSPHTLDQGYFNVENITATSCEFGVVWAAGFLTDSEETNGLTEGSFENRSKIRNVTCTFGQNAQMRGSRMRYIPCALRVPRSGGVGISSTVSDDGESYIAPSPAAVLSEEDRLGYYALDFPDTEVTAIGYNIAAHYLPPRAFVKSSNDDYEICNENVEGVDFFVPGAVRNTPNPRNPLETDGLSITDFVIEQIEIYPNPVYANLIIKLPKGNYNEELVLYNVLGKKVGNYKLQEHNNINVSHLVDGVYFMVFKNGLTKKIVIS